MHLLWYCSVVHKELEPNSVTVGKGHAHRQCQWHQKTIVAIARREVGLQVWRCACGEVCMWRGVHVERWHVERCVCGEVCMWRGGVYVERRCVCGEVCMWRGVHVERCACGEEVWRYRSVEVCNSGVWRCARKATWI